MPVRSTPVPPPLRCRCSSRSALIRAGLVLLSALSLPGPARALDLQAIDAYVQSEMRRDRVPGVAVAIVQGERVTFRSYGTAGEGRPVTPQTPFILGSMSKSFTALAVMRLVEEGRLDLNAPIQRVLPEFQLADASAARRITVAQLLNHTSGLPAQVAATRQARHLQDHLRLIADVKPLSAPGAEHHYSSVGYQVLGALVERVSGEPFAQVVERRILGPLGMTHSFTDGARAERAGLATGHRYWFGFPRPAALPFEADRLPTAGLMSSAEDLARYLQVFWRVGGTPGVISEEGRAALLRPTAPGDGFSYAMGWRVSDWGGVQAVHHGGVLPHYRGKIVLFPYRQAGVVVLTNAATALPFPIQGTSHRLADALAGSLLGRPLPSAGAELSLSLLTGLFALAAGLVLWTEVRKLLGWRRWRQVAAARPRRSVQRELLLEALPLAALLAGPPLLGLPWAEIFRSTPDLACWLTAVLTLSAASLLLKVWGRLRPARVQERSTPTVG